MGSIDRFSQVIRRIVTFLALALAIIFGLPNSAIAHTTLVASSPAADSTVTVWPGQVSLTFEEDLQVISGKKINFVTVTNAVAEQVNENTVEVKGRVVTVPLTTNTSAGPVLVNYRVAAQDGHIVEGEFTFTYGKSSEVAPSSSRTSVPHTAHDNSNNLPIYATSTVLIIAALLFGFWSYRKR